MQIAGLQLVINIQQDEYVMDIGDSAGIRLVVLPQKQMPFPEDEGLTISPGHYTTIAVKQVKISGSKFTTFESKQLKYIYLQVSLITI